jgi:hypothetical protein
MFMKDFETSPENTAFHPKFCDIPTNEYYCFRQYIHYTVRYLPRFVRIDVTYLC